MRPTKSGKLKPDPTKPNPITRAQARRIPTSPGWNPWVIENGSLGRVSAKVSSVSKKRGTRPITILLLHATTGG
jgi:hypothetical protein